ncbi:SHOCT domain-containing protein [Sinomonas soli]
MTLTTRYREVCTAAADQQAFLWWSLVWAGLAVLLIGLVWRFGRLPVPVVRRLRIAAAPLWAGAGLVFAGAVGGRVVPVGELCSGPFGHDETARAAMLNGGSVDALVACQAAAPHMVGLWWTVVVLGVLVFLGGVLLAVWPAKGAVRAVQRGAKRPAGPAWPFVGGLLVILGGLTAGFVIPVGPNCDGAFTGHTTAAGKSIADAFAGLPRTDYMAQCVSLSSTYAVIYWGVIAFGAALLVLGLILDYQARNRVAQPVPSPVAAPVPSVASELAALADLRDRGALTTEEFEAQKRRVLGG